MAGIDEPRETPEKQQVISTRRTFLGRAAVAIGAAIGAALAYPLIRLVVFPVSRTIVGSASEPIDVLAAEDIEAGADPVRVVLEADGIQDAWGVSEHVALGSAWVRKREDGEVVALSATCPHLGCAISFDDKAREFKCPCHKSAFAMTGQKKSGPSKRDLDPLPVTVEEGRVRITFVRYRQDIPEREPV